ncbi:hypothetical protein [Streptomyces tropicalis]|uniref:Uncharacterized protein n=1 Tax=Streptomyces tropicalis TaxID=3034234 RepID=A0ABT6A5D1_9ACTN|nr:hypothetical protein [Streptomyces tropicalis]MDF3299854.1 hypothetical protein [Streptomyces tropicalis]
MKSPARDGDNDVGADAARAAGTASPPGAAGPAPAGPAPARAGPAVPPPL